MKETIFIINFFDENEMKWYEKIESEQIQDKSPFEPRPQPKHKHKHKHTKWYHECGKPPIEAPIHQVFVNEFVQIPHLEMFEEFKEYVPSEEDEKYLPKW